MKANESLIAWTPETSRIRVGPWPDRSRWSDAYAFTDGACCTQWREAAPEARALLVMLAFHTAVVRDGVPVPAAHEAFLAIDEYRQRISPDTPGAEAV